MSEAKSIHLVPIGGTAMTPLAALFAEEGHRVTGSALDLYPPMSTLLDRSKSRSERVCGGNVPDRATASSWETGAPGQT